MSKHESVAFGVGLVVGVLLLIFFILAISQTPPQINKRWKNELVERNIAEYYVDKNNNLAWRYKEDEQPRNE